MSLLWSPHANWTLNTLFLLPLLNAFASTWARYLRCLSNRGLCTVTFLVSAVLFSGYTLYFCQITMLHGDEGQYLLVTQSLIRDGDMDLTNNIEPENIREFHVIDSFGLHKAPGSPAGKIHSVHPIGLSILLVPPYLAGLDLWQNPRLACALTMALMAAGCVALMLAWLLRLQIPPWAALATATIAASTGPLFLYTTQLYPDLPALFISLIALCAFAHWQVPGGGYRSWGRLEPLWLALLSATLAFLPFLHARFTPITLLAGVGIALQIRSNPKPKAALAPVVGVFVVALALLLQFNLAFSGDWLGPFRPGNAWEEGALDVETWWTSLPGHWLHGGVGLVNSTPIYLYSLLGLALLAKKRDRRLLIGAAVYIATAVVNGMHPDWKFGFCLPARFLVTSLPCLVLGLAVAMSPIVRNPGLAFIALFAFCVSADSIWMNLVLTEESYVGDNLFARSLNHYYPWQAHFNSDETLGFLTESFFIILLLAGLFARHLAARLGMGWTGWTLVGATALIPTVWGQMESLTSRLKTTTSHFMNRLDAEGGVGTHKMVGYDLNLKPLSVPRRKDGSIEAVGGRHAPGLVARAYMPLLEPGSYVLKLPDLQAQSTAEGLAPGHVLMLRRETVHVKSIWETRMMLPLIAGRDLEMIFHINRTGLGFTYLHFSGSGSLLLRRARLLHSPRIWESQAPRDSSRRRRCSFFDGDTAGARCKIPRCATWRLCRHRRVERNNGPHSGRSSAPACRNGGFLGGSGIGGRNHGESDPILVRIQTRPAFGGRTEQTSVSSYRNHPTSLVDGYTGPGGRQIPVGFLGFRDRGCLGDTEVWGAAQHRAGPTCADANRAGGPKTVPLRPTALQIEAV